MDSLRISENSLMGSSSGSNVHHQPSLEMPPPLPIKRKLDDRQPLEQSLFSSDASPTPEEPRSIFDQIPESPTAYAGHQQIINAVGTKKMRENEKAGNDFRELLGIGKVSDTDDMSLRAIAGDDVGDISAKMKCLTDDSRENIEKELIVILEGNDDSHKREYLMLQKLVQSRTDLTAMTLAGAHRSQLEILVAINTGSPAILQTRTSLSLSRTSLIQIFEQKRCRNVEKCETLLPANNCVCITCNNKKGFCNLCMCLICNKYEFKVDTDLSCNMCSHKIHKDCAMRNGLTGKSKAHPSKMVFRCQDCSKLIDLIIESCCKALDWEALIKDFDSFSRILRRSDNPGQKELFLKCEDFKEKMKNGTMLSSITGRELLMFFQELSMDAPQSVENGEGGKLIAPQEASNQIAEVERKMERDMPCSSEGTLVLEEEEDEEEDEDEEKEEHATPETMVIEEGKTSGQTEVKAPNNPDGVQLEEVQPLEQLQQLGDADGAQPELATRDAGLSSPNSCSNPRPSTLQVKFPEVYADVHLFNDPNMRIPNNLPFSGTYSASKDTTEDTTAATTSDQPQILVDFFRTHPAVQKHIESFSEGIKNTFSERLATLLHHLHFVKVRDFNEAVRAEVQEAWKDLTGAGCELQDLQPAVNQALHAKVEISKREEELTTRMQALERDIQACRDSLDNPPLYNSDGQFAFKEN